MSDTTTLRREAFPSFLPSPVIDHLGIHGEVCFRTIMWGRETNWSFAGLFDNTPLQRQLGRIALLTNTRNIFAPVPGFNAILARESHLGRHLHAHGATIHRHTNEGDSADAVLLGSRQAYAVSPANCPIFVATNGVKLIAAHAGRWSLFSPEVVVGEKRDARKVESVVDTVFDQLFTCEHDASHIRVWIYGGVVGSEFPHPLAGEHGKTNTALLEHIYDRFGKTGAEENGARFLLDLPHIIALQFCRRGVLEHNISLEHAYLDKEVAWTNGGIGQGRNLLFVARNK